MFEALIKMNYVERAKFVLSKFLNDFTEEEVEYTIKAVKEVVEYLRSISPIWRELCEGKKEFIIK